MSSDAKIVAHRNEKNLLSIFTYMCTLVLRTNKYTLAETH